MVYQIHIAGLGNIYNTDELKTQVLEPKLHMAVNEAGSFEFTLAPSASAYDKIAIFSSTVDVVENGDVIWTGRCIEIETTMNRNRRFRFEGALAYFNDVVLPYEEYKDVTIPDFFRSVISRYNSEVSNRMRKFTVSGVFAESDTKVWRKTDYETAWEVLEDMILNAEGGYLLVSKEYPGNYPVEIRYVEDFVDHGNQPLAYATNLVDLTAGLNAQNIVTDIVPICHYNDEVYTLKGFENETTKRAKQYKKDLNGSANVRPNRNGVMVNHALRNKYTRVEKVVEYDMLESFESVSSLEDKEKDGSITGEETIELATRRAKNKQIVLKTKGYMYKNAKKKAKELEYATFSITAKAADLFNLGDLEDVSDQIGEENMVVLDAVPDSEWGTAGSTSNVNSGSGYAYVITNDDEAYYDEYLPQTFATTDNFRLGQLITVLSKPHGISRELPITSIEIDLTSGVKSVTIGVPEAKELTKILAPKNNKARTSWKKDNTKHVTRGTKSNASGDTLEKIIFTEVDDPYYLNAEINLAAFKVGLLHTDGTTTDVTEDCTFTIDDAPAAGFVFDTRATKMLVAHYTYHKTITVEGEEEQEGDPETVDVELTCQTALTVKVAIIMKILFVRYRDWNEPYSIGDPFHLSEFAIQGEYDDGYVVDIPNNAEGLSFNINDNTEILMNTPRKLIAVYNSPSTNNIDRTAEVDLNIDGDSASDEHLGFGEEDSDGFRIELTGPSGKKYKKYEQFRLEAGGYKLRLYHNGVLVDDITSYYTDEHNNVVRYNIHGEGSFTPGKAQVYIDRDPNNFVFKHDGTDPTDLFAHYRRTSSKGVVHELPSNLVPLELDTGIDEIGPGASADNEPRLKFKTVYYQSWHIGQMFQIGGSYYTVYFYQNKQDEDNNGGTDVTYSCTWNLQGNIAPDKIGGVDVNQDIVNDVTKHKINGYEPKELRATYLNPADGKKYWATTPLKVDKPPGTTDDMDFYLEFTRTPGPKFYYELYDPNVEASKQPRAFFDLSYYTVMLKNKTNPQQYPATDVTRTPYTTYSIFGPPRIIGGANAPGSNLDPTGHPFDGSEDPDFLWVYYDNPVSGKQISAKTAWKIEGSSEFKIGESDREGWNLKIEDVAQKSWNINDTIEYDAYMVSLWKYNDPVNKTGNQKIISDVRMKCRYNIGSEGRKIGGRWVEQPSEKYWDYVIKATNPQTIIAYYTITNSETGASHDISAEVALSVTGTTSPVGQSDDNGFRIAFVRTRPEVDPWYYGENFDLSYYKVTLYQYSQVVKDDVTREWAHIKYNLFGQPKLSTDGTDYVYTASVNPDEHVMKQGDPDYLVATFNTRDYGGTGEVSAQARLWIKGRDAIGFGEADEEGRKLKFTKVYDGWWWPEENFRSKEYELTYYDENGNPTIVTNRWGQGLRYNIFTPGREVGGVYIGQSPDPNGYVFKGNGNDPDTLKAYWTVTNKDGTEHVLPAECEWKIKNTPKKGYSSGESDEDGRHLRFTKTSSRVYKANEQFNLAEYEVRYYATANDQVGTDVTGFCRYNIGRAAVIVGGVEVTPSSSNPNDYIIKGDGTDPTTLTAYYEIKLPGKEPYDLSADAPIYVEGSNEPAQTVFPNGTADSLGRRLAFTRVYGLQYAPGDHFDLSKYEVTFFEADGTPNVVTGSCTYNIGGEPTIIGGVVVNPGTNNPNAYVFTGHDPDNLYATYQAYGNTYWVGTPLNMVEVDELGRYIRFTQRPLYQVMEYTPLRDLRNGAGTTNSGIPIKYVITYHDENGNNTDVTKSATWIYSGTKEHDFFTQYFTNPQYNSTAWPVIMPGGNVLKARYNTGDSMLYASTTLDIGINIQAFTLEEAASQLVSTWNGSIGYVYVPFDFALKYSTKQVINVARDSYGFYHDGTIRMSTVYADSIDTIASGIQPYCGGVYVLLYRAE